MPGRWIVVKKRGKNGQSIDNVMLIYKIKRISLGK